MLPVLTYAKTLRGPTHVEIPAHVTLLCWSPELAQRWLELRAAATADLLPRPGHWSRHDLEREVLEQAWWGPDRFLGIALRSPPAAAPDLVAAVFLGSRPAGPAERYYLHWLLVAPGHRRQGWGRRLVALAENACYRAGARVLTAETHRQWTAARHFYERLGYAIRPGRSSVDPA